MLVALAAVVLSADGGAPDAGPKMPAGLSCLSKYYAGKPVSGDGGWFFELVSGERVPWRAPAKHGAHDGGVHRDGGTRDAGTRDAGTHDAGTRDAGALADGGEDEEDDDSLLPEPDLSQMYEVPYPKGPIVPVVGDEDTIEDPGRARVEQLLMETYGHSSDEVRDHLEHVRFFGTRWGFHQRAAPALQRVIEKLTAEVKKNPKLLKFVTDIGGTFKWRKIARSTNLSTHAFGIAIDLNVERGYYWRWQRPKHPLKWRNVVPQEIVDAFESEGFIWGGRWLHYDTMHFEYRPELLDPACRE